MMRNYDPSLGRYVEADPIGLDGASIANMNLYGYANQNPITWYDPDGRVAQVIAPVILPNLVRAAALAAGIALGNVIPFPNDYVDTGDEDSEQCGDREKDCDRQLDRDMETCDAISRAVQAGKRPKGATPRCRSSAMERYGNCLAGRPIGPLDTYNN